MKKVIFIITSILLSAVMFQSCKPSDAELQRNVNDALLATAPGVSATVKGQVATLEGTVESEEVKTAAGEAAKNTKNIKNVVNNIKVVPPVVINPDDTLMENLTASLNGAGFTMVNVSVRNGEVTLTGEVKKADLKKVMQIANEANPKKVVNQLKTK